MNILNFLDVPRGFGTPRQVLDSQGNPCVRSKKELINLINKNNNGLHDVFVSHNSYESFLERKPYQIRINKLFLDFDSKLDPPADSLEDIRKVIDYYDDVKIPYLPAYTGNRGFHCYIPLKMKIYTSGQWLKNAIRSCMTHLRRELKLTTIDPSVATPTKLCRVLYSIHPKTGRVCCPLKSEWIRSWDINKIIDFSIDPKRWSSDLLKDKKYLTLEEYIEYLNIDIEEEITKLRESFALQCEQINYGSPDNEFLCELLHYPCLINAVIGVKNATHFARFMCCTHLKKLGYDPVWIFKFFKQRLYLDHMYEEESKYQINNIFQEGYIFPSCKRIQEEGMCIGKDCKYYKKINRR